jgi:uncharacterized protein (AIM24 family)/outer membrane protein assembly factor BamD (BamD/ComL family)
MVDTETYSQDDGTPEEDFIFLLNEGTDLMQAGRLPEAREHLERALELRPESEQAQNLLGLTLFRIGELDRAGRIFAELVHENPIEPSLRLNLAMVHVKAKAFDEAYEELEKVLDLNPEHTRAASYMAMVCEQLERFDESAEWYERTGNSARAEELRSRDAGSPGGSDGVPEPPPLDLDDPLAVDEQMPDPGLLLGGEPTSDGVHAATLSAITAETLGRPGDVPTPEAAISARGASMGFTLDEPEVPEPPPLSGGGEGGGIDLDAGFEGTFDEEPVEKTLPYAPMPTFPDDPPPKPAVGLHVGGPLESATEEVPAPPTDTPLDEPVEKTLPYAPMPTFPDDEPPQPLAVSAEDVELVPVEDETPEGTRPYAVIPAPPPGRRGLRDEDEAEASVSPPLEDEPPAQLDADELEMVPAPEPEADAEPEAPPSEEIVLAGSPPEPEPMPEPILDLEPPPPPVDDAPLGAPMRASMAPVAISELLTADAARASDHPRQAEGGVFVWPVRDVAYVRADRMVGLGGAFEVEPVNRRYRGRRTDSFFGGTEHPLFAALGDGTAWLSAGDDDVTVLALGEEEAYLLEERILAFSGGLVWENGRLPEEGSRDLDIVHLRGKGSVALLASGSLFALEVDKERPVTVAADRLVGWSGPLVPSRAAFPGLPESVERPSIVRFDGTGRVLLV